MPNLLNLAMNRGIVDKKSILDKIDKAKEIDTSTKTVVTKNGVIDTIATVSEHVEKYLGDKKDCYLCLTNEIEITYYFDQLIEKGIVALDTETTGLDPMSDDIVGFSVYAKGLKAAYIPVNHVSYITNIKIEGQPSREFIKSQLDRFNEHNTKIIMHNATFDVRIIRHTLNTYLTCWFDTSLAARLLNENEPSNKLKDLHKKYILHGQEDEFTFSALFADLRFDLIPIKYAYLYGAKDAEITYELFEFQYRYLNPDDEMCISRELQDVAKLFWEIEMPVVEVLADMEDTGISLDLSVNEKLKSVYLPKQDAALKKFDDMLKAYNINEHIDMSSPKQLAHLFYDILGLVSPDKKAPRGTGAKILNALDHPIIDAIKDYRSVATLIDSFILKLPDTVASDGKVHCNYLQIGADTGRFACKDPNMQNIPSHAKDIRQMFTASTEYHKIENKIDNSFDIPTSQEINTPNGWIRVKDIAVGDQIIINNNEDKEILVNVTNILLKDKNTVCVNWQ